MKKLYITDLDGTLLSENGKMSSYAVELLNQIIEQGTLITVATGRSFLSAANLLKETHLTLPIINNNGARISLLHNHEHVYSNFIDKSLAQEILDITLDHYCSPFINAELGGKDLLLYEASTNKGTEMFIDIRKSKDDPRLKKVDKYDQLNDIKVVNFNIIDETKKLMVLEKHLEDKYQGLLDLHITFEPTWHDWAWLTISDIKSNKADGIAALVSEYIHEDVEITVFGDQRNDIHMLEYADRAIVVENARPEVKTIADLVIGPNTEESVVRFIAQEIGLKLPELDNVDTSEGGNGHG